MRLRMVFIVILATLLAGALAFLAQAPATTPAAPAPQAETQAKGGPQGGLATEPAPPMGVAPTGKTRFVGTLANTGGSLYLGGFFTLEIDKWTTPEEAAQAKQICMQSGQKALLDKVWKSKQIGYFKIGNSLGKAIFFARAIPVHGGVIIRCLTNSSMGRGYGRAGDYPFGVLELAIPNEGKGNGTLVGMAKISFSADGTAQVEAYGTIPEKIMDVEIEKK